MKKIFSFLLITCLATVVTAQAPANYYNSITTQTGASLKTALRQVITNTHNPGTYNELWDAYYFTDRDYFYEDDETILDIYSERITQNDPYNYTIGVDQCGNYGNEGDCYNREHIVPQSLFGEAAPMKSDVHFIRATDGQVNGIRSNYPFGMVGSANYTSLNGSKRGSSVSPGFSGTVFEPIDAFKGDVARMIFYFVTRYETQLSGFSSGNMLGNSAYPGLQPWFLQQMLIWHAQDPVSKEEIHRNNLSQSHQGNRNPFIDNPRWVNDIWGSADATVPSTPLNLTLNSVSATTVSISWGSSTDNTGVGGYDIFVNGVYHSTVPASEAQQTTIAGLTPATAYTFYVVAKDLANNSSANSNTVSVTTPSGIGSSACGSEDFANIPYLNLQPAQHMNRYVTRNWTGINASWNATFARTSETVSGKAITLKNGELTSSSIAGGITSITVTTQQKFTGSPGNLTVYINGTNVGTVPYSSTPTTTTISNLNVSGNFIIKLSNTTSNNRVAIDNISWTCTSLSTQETSADSAFIIYPNPIMNGELFVKGKDLKKIHRAEIYSMEGRLVQSVERPFIHSNKIVLNNLAKGMYILKAGEISAQFMVK